MHIARATAGHLNIVLGLIEEAATWLRFKGVDQWRQPMARRDSARCPGPQGPGKREDMDRLARGHPGRDDHDGETAQPEGLVGTVLYVRPPSACRLRPPADHRQELCRLGLGAETDRLGGIARRSRIRSPVGQDRRLDHQYLAA